MSGTIILRKQQWDSILQQLKTEYPPSVFLIRTKMREVLGFTPRLHRQWISESHEYSRGYYRERVHLDFYNDSAETFFTLKYLHNT